MRDALFSSTKGINFRVSQKLIDRPSTQDAWAHYCAEILGPPHQPDTPFTTREYNVAFALQQIVEEIVLSLVSEAHDICRSDNLCLAGGVFANSIVNGKIVRQGIFKKVYIPPWPNDSGLSIGAGLFALAPHFNYKSPRKWSGGAYLGSKAEDSEIENALKKWHIPIEKIADIEFTGAKLLSEGLIIGWYQGPMEVGPRALGARSILALPNIKGIDDFINKYIKYRELWRPFAPSILDIERERLFGENYESPYMSFVHPVTDFGKQALKSTLSPDNMARLQVVTSDENPLFYKLLIHIAGLTGVGALLNTSFNVQGEPIVRTPDEAIRTFLASAIDILIMGNYIVHKTQLTQCDQKLPLPSIIYPRVVPSLLAEKLKDRKCLLLWMDSRIQSVQVDFLKGLCANVDSISLPKNWLNPYWKTMEISLTDWNNNYDFIILGSIGYLPFTLDHLSNVILPFVNHCIMQKVLILDRDLSMGSLEKMITNPNGIHIIAPPGELEFIWQNLREDKK